MRTQRAVLAARVPADRPPATSADPRWPADRPVRWRRALPFAAVGLGAFAFSRALPAVPPEWRASFLAAVGAFVARPLSFVTGVVPFAVGELVLALYVVCIAFGLTRAVAAAGRRRRRWRNVAAAGACTAARDGGIMLFIFYTIWGLNYARPPLVRAEEVPAWGDVEVAERVALAERIITAANAAYIELHGTADTGSPTTLPEQLRSLEAALDTGWTHAAALLALPARSDAPRGRVKWPLASPLIAHFGITGMYFPFTAEANVVRGLPAVHAPQTMAHEKAHQRGFASEAEASFVGFIAGALAPHPLSRYSAALFAYRQIVGSLRFSAPEEYRRVVALPGAGVHRDMKDANAYFDRHRGVARTLGDAINHRYLRANGVAGGTADYASSARMIVAFARRHGGDPLPAAAGQGVSPAGPPAAGQGATRADPPAARQGRTDGVAARAGARMSDASRR